MELKETMIAPDKQSMILSMNRVKDDMFMVKEENRAYVGHD